MSLSVVYTRAALGVKAPLISVEVHLSSGLPGLTLVGLPETTVKEARDRVRSAIINSGYTFPAKKITVDSIGQRNSYVKTWGCGGFLNETNIYSRGKSLCF